MNVPHICSRSNFLYSYPIYAFFSPGKEDDPKSTNGLEKKQENIGWNYMRKLEEATSFWVRISIPICPWSHIHMYNRMLTYGDMQV